MWCVVCGLLCYVVLVVVCCVVYCACVACCLVFVVFVPVVGCLRLAVFYMLRGVFVCGVY